MQSLDVISINIWQIIISALNLLILFLILKKFLFKPVNSMLAKRQEEVDNIYSMADIANKEAMESKEKWEKTLESAHNEADLIIKEAASTAGIRGDKIVADAKSEAENIIRQAENEADLYLKKAEAGVKSEIVTISALLTEKMLNREINTDDHRTLIDSVIDNIGDNNDGNV